MRQCGVVYGSHDLLAIECALCAERTQCSLEDFPRHMTICHTASIVGDVQIVAKQDSPASQPTPSNLHQADDELMLEVLAELAEEEQEEQPQLKQQLVQQLNDETTTTTMTTTTATTTTTSTTTTLQTEQEPSMHMSLSDQVAYGLHATLPAPDSIKLSTEQMSTLIHLYRKERRLWDQSHPEFRNVELCRNSWHQITADWSAHCQRQFQINEVRTRMSTLCQRFLKQRERLELNANGNGSGNGSGSGELGGDVDVDAINKFIHYDELSFLCEQQALLKRSEHHARENRKLLEIYEHYPLLWHNAHKGVGQRCPEMVRARHEAQRGLQLALRMCGINLSTVAVQRRLQSLRKRYRLEKIHYLHSVVRGRQAQFVSTFEHYEQMEFLHKHIDPFVCAICGSIFDQLAAHQAHVQNGCKESSSTNSSSSSSIPINGNNLDLDLDMNMDLDCEATVGEIMSQLEQVTQEEEIPKETVITTDEEVKKVESGSNLIKVQCIDLNYSYELPVQEPVVVVATATTIMPTTAGGCVNGGGGVGGERVGPRLTLAQTFKLIELYQGHRCLWDPNHLDYNMRKQRRLAWHNIAAQLNVDHQWQALHRKLTDYVKYYRRERDRVMVGGRGTRETTNAIISRWCFYDAFRFLDDVLPPAGNELQQEPQRRQLRIINRKIIAAYRGYPQLWCTDHPDYTKRRQRHRHVEALCTRLLQDSSVQQLSVERLKNRLIEFRCHYRQCKQARLDAIAASAPWTPNYEYYEELRFLDPHVRPFSCGQCGVSFSKRSECLLHERNVHDMTRVQRVVMVEESGAGAKQQQQQLLDHICHICGMKFSLRNSLLAHLRRHLGQRTHACSECPKRFFNATALRVHHRSHTKELPYVCEHCARGFVNASKLNQHVKRHRNQRDFPCTRCDKAFYTAHERDRHTRSHLNIRDKICPYCDRAFVVGSAYYAHLNLHRSDKRYVCTTCNRRFAQYAGLYKHRKRCLPTEQSIPQPPPPPLSS